MKFVDKLRWVVGEQSGSSYCLTNAFCLKRRSFSPLRRIVDLSDSRNIIMKLSLALCIIPFWSLVNVNGQKRYGRSTDSSYPRPQQCCLDFPPATTAHTGTHHHSSPAVPPFHQYDSTKPRNPHSSSKLANPIFDRLLFVNTCPAEKTPQEICDAVSLLYGKPHTALFAKPLSPYEIVSDEDDVVGSNYRTVNEDYMEEPIFVKDEWLSHTDADVGVVESNCCFNLYNDVRPGDQLSAECHNGLLETKSAFSDLFDYSIMTPGDLEARCGAAECRIAYSVIVGNDVQMFPWTVAQKAATVTGSFSGIGFWVGGNIDFSSVISVVNGEFYLGGINYGQPITAPAKPLTKAQIEEGKARISAQVCALSHAILATHVPTDANIVKLNGNKLGIECAEDAIPCIVNLDAKLLNEATEVLISNPSREPVTKINVRGRDVVFIPIIKTPGGNHIIWNCVDADTVIIIPTIFHSSLVAPRASQVVIQSSVQGSVLMGNPNSHLTIDVAADDGFPGGSSINCPYPDPKVTLCDCLCPEEKKKPKKMNATSPPPTHKPYSPRDPYRHQHQQQANRH